MKNKVQIMGIINITRDSFYPASRTGGIDDAIRIARNMIEDGATILDIGACSTRPGSTPVSESEEREAIIPVLKALKREFPHTRISIDTFRHDIAREAIDNGVDIINDISGGNDNMWEVVRNSSCSYILTHNPEHTGFSPTDDTHLYIDSVIQWYEARIKQMRDMGIENIIIDPGFGFGKTMEENYHILSHMDMLKGWGLPILAGLSRKSMIYKTLSISPEQALGGTMVLNAISIEKGADILRVHDVKEASQVIKLVEMVSNN